MSYIKDSTSNKQPVNDVIRTSSEWADTLKAEVFYIIWPWPLLVFSYFVVFGMILGLNLWAGVQPIAGCKGGKQNEANTNIELGRRSQLWMVCLQTATDKS